MPIYRVLDRAIDYQGKIYVDVVEMPEEVAIPLLKAGYLTVPEKEKAADLAPDPFEGLTKAVLREKLQDLGEPVGERWTRADMVARLIELGQDQPEA